MICPPGFKICPLPRITPRTKFSFRDAAKTARLHFTRSRRSLPERHVKWKRVAPTIALFSSTTSPQTRTTLESDLTLIINEFRHTYRFLLTQRRASNFTAPSASPIAPHQFYCQLRPNWEEKPVPPPTTELHVFHALQLSQVCPQPRLWDKSSQTRILVCHLCVNAQ